MRLTHIRRTNQHVTPSSAPQSFRIFRQGYPFLERSQASPFFRTGLNFVSFQNNPRRLLGILTTDSWLGGTNFGGGPALSGAGAPAGRLLTAYAAGIFFVPPRASSQEPFPGSAAFT